MVKLIYNNVLQWIREYALTASDDTDTCSKKCLTLSFYFLPLPIKTIKVLGDLATFIETKESAV